MKNVFESFARSPFNLGDVKGYLRQVEKRLSAYPTHVPFGERVARLRRRD